MIRSAFSDIQCVIDETIAEDDKVAIRYNCAVVHYENFFASKVVF